MGVLLAVLIALLFVACDDDNTVEPPPLPPQLSLDHYHSNNGLPNDDVYDIFVDSQGRTWFATQKGLGVLDNGTMSTIGQIDGLIHPNTRAVAEFDGKFYIGTWGGGVGVYDGVSWEEITVSTGFISNSIMSIAVDDTSLYFATVQGVSQYNPTSGVFKRFTALAPSRQWTATNKRILRDIQTSSVEAILTPRGPEVWMGAVYGYITVWRPAINNFITYSASNSGLPGESINAIKYNSADGLFWVGTALHGVASVDVPNSTWTHYEQTQGLPSSVINSIAVDQSGVVWVATNEGIAKKEGSRFISYSKASGLPEERVRKVFIDSQDRIWLGFVEGGAALLK